MAKPKLAMIHPATAEVEEWVRWWEKMKGRSATPEEIEGFQRIVSKLRGGQTNA